MKMIIEISGGCLCNITATEPVSIYILDHDNLKESDEAVEDARQAQQPDLVCDEDELQEKLNEALEEYNERR